MIVFEVAIQVIFRLGIIGGAAFMAVCLGAIDYILVKESVFLASSGVWQIGLEWATYQVIMLCSAAMVVVLLTCASIGVFVWGIACSFELD
jgi:hypothetical protein